MHSSLSQVKKKKHLFNKTQIKELQWWILNRLINQKIMFRWCLQKLISSNACEPAFKLFKLKNARKLQTAIQILKILFQVKREIKKWLKSDIFLGRKSVADFLLRLVWTIVPGAVKLFPSSFFFQLYKVILLRQWVHVWKKNK